MTQSFRLGYEARTLNLINQGMLPATEEVKSRTRMLAYIKVLESEHNALFYTSAALLPEHTQLMRTPTIPVKEKSGSRYLSRLYSMDEMVRATLSHARLVWEAPIHRITMEDDHVYFLLANQEETFFPAFNSSNKFNAREGINNLNQVADFQLIFMALAVSSVFIVMILVFRPAMARVERTKSEVLQLFLHLSKSSVRALLLQTEQHIQGLTSEDVSHADDNVQNNHNAAGGGGDDDDHRINVSTGNKNQRVKTRNAAENNDNSSSNSSNRCCSRFCDGMTSSQYVMIIKTTLIFLISVGFFVGMYAWGKTVVTQTSYLIKEIEYSERSTRAVQVNMLTRELYAVAPQSQTDIDARRQKGYDVIAWIQFICTALTYGSDFIGTPGTAGRHPGQDAVAFGNMCAPNPYATFSPGCDTYWNRVNTHGLQSAYLEYLNVASSLFDSYNASAPVNLTSSKLWFIHTMQTTYLLEGLSVVRGLYLVESDEITNSYFDGTMLLLVSYSLTLLSLFIFMYRPLIEDLSKDSSRTRGTLFMVPFEVLESVPHIRQFLKDKAKMLLG